MKDEWVIAYDLNVKAMKADGYTKSNVTQYYTNLRNTLAKHGFGKFTQNSLYSSNSDDALKGAYQIIDDIRGGKDPQFVNRLHLFRVEHFTNLRSLLPELETVDIDPIEVMIDEVFADEKEDVSN